MGKRRYEGGCIGLALAGYEARRQGRKDAKHYDNPLTDLINICIAEAAVNQRRKNREARISRRAARRL